MYRVWNYVTNYSLLLIGGALLALIWANVAPESYHHVVDYPLIDNFFMGHLHEEGGSATRTLTFHFLVNDVLMAFFFAVAWSMLSPRSFARNTLLSVKKSGPEQGITTSVSPEGSGFSASACFFLLLQAVNPPESTAAARAKVSVRVWASVFMMRCR
jgi:Na+/H+ antiporter NhaA